MENVRTIIGDPLHSFFSSPIFPSPTKLTLNQKKIPGKFHSIKLLKSLPHKLVSKYLEERLRLSSPTQNFVETSKLALYCKKKDKVFIFVGFNNPNLFESLFVSFLILWKADADIRSQKKTSKRERKERWAKEKRKKKES